MTRKCCVPNCQTNATPTVTDDRKHLRRPCFRFPTDEELRLDWLKRIPRNNINTEYSGVCILHFEPRFIKLASHRHRLVHFAIPTIFSSYDPSMDSETYMFDRPNEMYHQQNTTNQQHRLVENTFPSILPSFIESSVKREPKEIVNEIDSQQNTYHQSNVSNYESEIINFNHLRSHLTSKVKLHNWMVAPSDQSILIFNLNKESSGNVQGDLSVRCTININNDLVMKVFVKGIVAFDLKLSKWTQLQNVIDKLKIETSRENDMGFELDNLIVVKNNDGKDIESKTIGLSEYSEERPDLNQIQQVYLNCTVKVEPPSSYPEFEGYFFNDGLVEETISTPKKEPDLLDNPRNICSECGKEFDQHIKLLIHMKRHDPNACQLCPTCNKRVYGNFERHKKSHEEKRYDCNICKSIYKSSTALKEHMNSKHTIGEFYCDICNDRLNLRTKSRLRGHMRKHVNNVNADKPPVDIENFQVEWLLAKKNELQKVFGHTLLEDKFRISEMEASLTVKQLPNICSTCGKGFSKPEKLVVHMKRHDRSRWKVCPICNKSFPDGLSRHMATHTNSKNYVCDICGSAYSQAYSLKVHKDSNHLATGEFFCDICKNGRIYRSRDHLKIHLKNSHIRKMVMTKNGLNSIRGKAVNGARVKKFGCPYCDSTFTSNGRLQLHMLSVHPQGEKQYECLICKKSFAYKSLLTIHKQIHSTDNKFTCNDCGKTFKLASYLRKHLPRHKGVDNKRQICSLCGKKYVNGVDLRAHLKKVHGIDEKPYETGSVEHSN